VLAAFAFFASIAPQQTAVSPKPSPAERPATSKQEISNKIALEYSWEKSGFGTIFVADFHIRNDSEFDIKDVKIKCIHSAPSGTKIDSNEHTLYEYVGKRMSRRFPEVNMGFIDDQTVRTSCTVTDFVVVGSQP
jgi:hypothetical protein